MLKEYAVLSLVFVLLAACRSTPAEESPLPSPSVSPPMSPTAGPTLASTLAPTQTSIPTITPAVQSTLTLTPAGMAPPAGLIYGTTDGLWRIEASGQAVQLLDQPGAVLSPDGTRALYPKGYPVADELWLVDLTTGQQRNLIAKPDRLLCCIQWWPARPNVILFGSWPRDDWGPSTGFLTALELDSGKMHILDEKSTSNGYFARSPDGQTIAYDRAGAAWFYRWNKGSQPFDPRRYGLSKIERMGSAAWSLNGQQLAWYVGGDFGRGWQVGIAVFDLKSGTARLLHIYSNLGRGGWFAAPTWSPDGRWLAFNAEDQNQAQAGLWVVRADGQREKQLGMPADARGYALPVSSPDGRWLAAGRTLYEVGPWTSQPLNLPEAAWIIAWPTAAD